MEKEVSVYWNLPSGLKKECKTATKVLNSVIKEIKSDLSGTKDFKEKEKTLYQHHILNAAGIMIIRFVKVAFIGSLRYGNGLMFTRLPNSKWSAPACVETAGIGFGASIGLSVSNEVFFMNEAAAKAFKKGGNITVGADVQLTVLSLGRGAEGDLALGKTRQGAHIYSYSKSVGLYGAIEVTSGGIIERRKDNQKYYGDNIKIGDILEGRVLAHEEDVAELYEILNSGGNILPNIGSSSSDEISQSPRGPTPEQYSYPPPHVGVNQSNHVDNFPPPPHVEQYTYPPQGVNQSNHVDNFPPPPQEQLNFPPPENISHQSPQTEVPLAPLSYPKYRVLYDFDQPQEGELPIKIGETISVMEPGPTMWWLAQNEQGMTGKVPGNYLIPL